MKQIFDLYANTDCSLGKIARIIKADRPAELWNNIKLSRILHNPSYVAADADIYHYYKSLGCVLVNPIEEFTGEKGCMLYGKRDRGANKYRNLNEHVLSLGLHDGVVSSATFLACQRKLASNQQIKNSGKGKHTWLTGLLKCGACGYSMVVKTYQESKYLYCSGKQNNQCDATFQNFSLDDVETIIQNAVCEKLALLPADAAQKQQQQNTAEINELKIALYKIEDEIQSLMGKLAAANDVLTAYINRRILELDEQKHALNDKIGKTLQKEETAALPTQEEFLSGDMAFKKKTASRLIEKIYIKKDDIEIVWK